MWNIAEIARNLTRHIPNPRRKSAKAQQSWRTLKLGDHLEVLPDHRVYSTEVGNCTAGAIFAVAACDSLGMTIQVIEGGLVGGSMRWVFPAWKETFKKVRKSRGGK